MNTTDIDILNVLEDEFLQDVCDEMSSELAKLGGNDPPTIAASIEDDDDDDDEDDDNGDNNDDDRNNKQKHHRDTATTGTKRKNNNRDQSIDHNEPEVSSVELVKRSSGSACCL